MINFQKLFGAIHQQKSIPEVEWQKPPLNLSTHLGETHVWKIKWTNFTEQQYIPLLTTTEHQETLKFRSLEDQKKRILSRGILKELSSKYLVSSSKDLNYGINRFGKRFIINHTDILQFNISHSTDYILMVFGFGPEPLGIDIERNNLLFDYLNIADQYFSDQEKKSLTCENPSEQFFKIWTRKEAIIKAIGNGLNDTFFQINVLTDAVHLAPHIDQTFFLKTFKTADHLFSISTISEIKKLRFFEYNN